jgi:polyphenol oxidase
LPDGTRVALTQREDGDARPISLGGVASSEVLHKSICDRPWTFVHQVHRDTVLAIERPQPHLEDADALVTSATATPLAVLGADCALVGLANQGAVAVAHAGWRGIVAGIIDRTVERLRAEGDGEIRAVVSACVHPECYPFSAEDVDRVAAVLGDAVRARTPSGEVALDLPAAVRLALDRAGIEVAIDVDSCTACSGRWFSHRSWQDRARQALVIWREEDRG